MKDEKYYEKELYNYTKELFDFCGFDMNNVEVKAMIPHSIPDKLKDGEKAIYVFIDKEDSYLKIGRVNSKSNARYRLQHYLENGNKSTLAHSIINNKEFLENHPTFNKDNPKEWMLENLYRVNIILNGNLDIFVLNLLEAYLHKKCDPMFEGPSSLRK